MKNSKRYSRNQQIEKLYKLMDVRPVLKDVVIDELLLYVTGYEIAQIIATITGEEE